MPMFITDATHHRRQKAAVREGPVRNGQTGVVTRDQRTRDQEKKSAASRKNGKAVHAAVGMNFHLPYNSLPHRRPTKPRQRDTAFRRRELRLLNGKSLP